MAYASTNESKLLGKGTDRIDINRTVASLLSEEGLMIAVLSFALPTQLSINWGLGFTVVGLILIAWKNGYPQGLPAIVGPYRFVRNPPNLALWMMSFGAALAARSFPGVILSLILLPWLFSIDRDEDLQKPDWKMLSYRFRVPALIPTLIPFDATPKIPFSWRLAVKVQRWPSQSRLVSALLIWVYLVVSFEFNLPFWSGLVVTAGWIGIKLLLRKGKLSSFTFRKKVDNSNNNL